MRGKNGQASTEMLLLVGLVFILIITISFYTLRPSEEIESGKVYESAKAIAEAANNVAELDVGTKLQIKVEIPGNVENVMYADGEVRFMAYEGGVLVDVSEKIRSGLVGFRFLGSDFAATPGIYDLILENYGSGTCIYPPGGREEYCRCFSDSIGTIQLEQVTSTYTDTILCDADGLENIQCLGATEGGTLVYGSNVTGLRSRCIEYDNLGSQVDAKNYVKYTITNWLDEIVFEEFVFGPDELGYFNLTDAGYQVDNSDNLDVMVTCYSECYELRQDAFTSGGITGGAVTELREEDLKKDTIQTFFIPYGIVVPFLLDAEGNKIYAADCASDPVRCSRFNLLHPSGQFDKDFDRGNVEAEETFVVRTGFECQNGECINVDASLWHTDYSP